MDSQIVFSFKDLMLFVLWGFLVGVFAYIIMILRRVYKLMKMVNNLAEEHKPEFDEIIRVVPSLTGNIDAITSEVAHDIGAFRGTVENIAETTEAVTDVINEQKTAVSSISSVIATLSMIAAFINKFFGRDDETGVNDQASSVQKTANTQE